MLACLFHYDIDTSLLMRYLGNNYTGAHREISAIVSALRFHKIDPILIDKYVRVMLTGCPNHFVAETTRANALLHWRMRNHLSIDQKLPQVRASTNKEDRNNFVIPLPHWIARFTPHRFFTPQHILEKPGKKDQQIFDASRRYTPWSTPINMMTSTHTATPLHFGYPPVHYPYTSVREVYGSDHHSKIILHTRGTGTNLQENRLLSKP
jgi:hypothetical protein